MLRLRYHPWAVALLALGAGAPSGATEVLRAEVQLSLAPSAERLLARASLTVSEPGREIRLELGPQARFEADGIRAPKERSGARVEIDAGRRLVISDAEGRPWGEARLAVAWSLPAPREAGGGLLLPHGAGWLPGGTESSRVLTLRADLPDGLSLVPPPAGVPLARPALAIVAGSRTCLPRQTAPDRPGGALREAAPESLCVIHADRAFRAQAGALARRLAAERDRLVGLIGPLPWSEISVIVDRDHAALTAPGLVVLGPGGLERALEPDADLGPLLVDQWWGHAAIPAAGEERWVAGLALHSGDRRFDDRGSEVERRDTRRRVLYDLAESRREGSTRAADEAGWAALVLAHLGRTLSRESLLQATRELYARRDRAPIGWRQLEASLAAVVGRGRVGRRVAEWAEVSSPPRIWLESIEERARDIRANVALELRSDRDWSAFSLEVALWGLARETRASTTLSGRRARLVAIAGHPVESVAIDPDFTVPRELPLEAVPANLARARDRGPDLVVLAADRGEAMARAARGAAGVISGGKARVVLAADLDRELLASSGVVVVLGDPGSWAALPPEVEIGREGFALRSGGGLRLERGGSRRVRGEGAGIAVALEHGPPGEGVLVVIDALSRQGYERAWRSIESDRSYGVLLFDSTTGVVYGHPSELDPGALAR